MIIPNPADRIVLGKILSLADHLLDVREMNLNLSGLKAEDS
jgi:hypothetical protein